MSAQIQTFTALAIVAVAATWLVLRALAKKKNPGCGGDCGCATDDLKAQLKRQPAPPAAAVRSAAPPTRR